MKEFTFRSELGSVDLVCYRESDLGLELGLGLRERRRACRRTNVNVSIRVASPGANGPVTQTNLATTVGEASAWSATTATTTSTTSSPTTASRTVAGEARTPVQLEWSVPGWPLELARAAGAAAGGAPLSGTVDDRRDGG